MKEIMIGYIIVAFVCLLLIVGGLCLVMNHTNSVARNATGQADFDSYIFIHPDGELFDSSYYFIDETVFTEELCIV